MKNDITGRDILFVSVFGGLGLTAIIGSLIVVNNKQTKSDEIVVNFPEESYDDKLSELNERKERRKVYEKEFKELSYMISENSLNVKDIKSFDFNECNYKLNIVNQTRINNDIKIKELETELKLAKVI